MKVNIQLSLMKQKAEDMGITIESLKVYNYIYWEYLPLEYELGIYLDNEKKEICNKLKISLSELNKAVKELINKSYARTYKGKFILRGDEEAKECYHNKLNANNKYNKK